MNMVPSAPSVLPRSILRDADRFSYAHHERRGMRSLMIAMLVVGAMAYAPAVWGVDCKHLPDGGPIDLCEVLDGTHCCNETLPKCCESTLSSTGHVCTYRERDCCPGHPGGEDERDVCHLPQRCCPKADPPACCDAGDTCCMGGCFPPKPSRVFYIKAACCGGGACYFPQKCCPGTSCSFVCCPPGGCKWIKIGFSFADRYPWLKLVSDTAKLPAAAAELLNTQNSPDQLFTEVARPLVPSLQQPLSDQGTSPAQLNMVNDVRSVMQKATGLMVAIRVSLNRAEGAAMAKDKASESLQIQAAQRYAGDLSAVFEKLSRQLKPFRKVLREAGANCVTSRSDVANQLSEVRSGRIPPDVVSIWGQLGLEQPLLKELKEKVLTDALSQWLAEPVRCDRLFDDASESFHQASQDFARFAKSPPGEAPRRPRPPVAH